jgi:transglutaminase-like putative cysteine protease
MFSITRNCIIISGVIILSACSSTSEWASRVAWTEIDTTALPRASDYQDASAVILLNEGKVEIYALSENKFSVFDRHQVIKIFDPRGYKYANVMIPYGSQSQVESIEARTISPDGEISVLNPDKIYDVNLYPDFVFYSDQRAKIFTMPAVENDCIVEYRYSITINSSTYGNSWRFQETIPMKFSRFTLLKPSEWEVEYRQYGFDAEPEIVEAPAGFKTSLIWSVSDMPALKSEIAMPPRLDLGARLALSPVAVRTWPEISRWYADLLKPQMDLRGDLKSITSKIIKGLETDEEKLRAIYEWTRDRIRYIAVAIGIGGYEPNPVQDIMHNKYGDCKDMTILMCAIAEEAGLDVYSALISTRNHGIPDTSLPAVSQFNHVIAFCPTIGDSGIWMDATDKTCPFGQLPWYDQGMAVLLVKPDETGEIVYTPKSVSGNNRSQIVWDAKLDLTGMALISGTSVYWGAAANEIRQKLFYSSKDAHRRWLELYLATRCSGSMLDTFNISGVYPVEDPLKIHYTFRTPSFAQSTDRSLSFQPAVLSNFDLPDYFRSPKRFTPIQFQFPSRSSFKLTVKLPNGSSMQNQPVKDSLNSNFGHAQWVYMTELNEFIAECSYQLNSEVVEPADYKYFQQFLDRIRRRDLRQVYISTQ